MGTSMRPFMDEATRAIMIAGFLQGKLDEEIAQDCGISVYRVAKYRAALPPEVFLQLRNKDVHELEKLVCQNLRKGFQAMNHIADITENEDWIKQQSAGELAELYGEIGARTLQILEAFERAEERQKERLQLTS